MKEITQSTCVVVARELNVSIFQQLWLVENNIIDKDDFVIPFFSPAAVEVKTKNFTFFAVPDRLQITVNSNIENAGNIYAKTAARIVEILPHTPIVGMGVNFNVMIKPTEQSKVHELSKKAFWSAENPLTYPGDESNPLFGFYMSANVEKARLKLDVKPIVLGEEKAFLMSFNFHHDLGDDKPNEIKDAISKFSSYFKCCNTMSDPFAKFVE